MSFESPEIAKPARATTPANKIGDPDADSRRTRCSQTDWNNAIEASLFLRDDPCRRRLFRSIEGVFIWRQEPSATIPLDAAVRQLLKAERASLAAQSRRIETEAAPIRYVAELVGADRDSERAIRWLIALMVLTCDPLAIALTAAASARRSNV
jgi:hypothetical protein